jgi:hypothetical protein
MAKLGSQPVEVVVGVGRAVAVEEAEQASSPSSWLTADDPRSWVVLTREPVANERAREPIRCGGRPRRLALQRAHDRN